jgi:type III restriction enzyme
MNPHVNTISNRLSLRPPQRDSLEILARLCEIIPLQKDGDTARALEIIKLITVHGLIDFNDISYGDHATLPYKLAGQVAAHLRTYLNSEEDAVNVLQYHQQLLVNLIHAQMQAHVIESATEYDIHVTKGFHTLRPNIHTADQNEHGRDFRAPILDGERHRIGTLLFGGFQKCLYSLQKLDVSAYPA